MLFDGDFGAAGGAAAKQPDFAAGVFDYAVAGGVYGEIATQISAVTGSFGLSGLADDDLAVLDLLAAKQLDAEAFTGAVVDVFAGTACFDFTHFL